MIVQKLVSLIKSSIKLFDEYFLETEPKPRIIELLKKE